MQRTISVMDQAKNYGRNNMKTMRGQILGVSIMIFAYAMGSKAQTVTGSGTPNTVPVVVTTTATANVTTTTLGDSPITVSGSNVGIGTIGIATPDQALVVNGNIKSILIPYLPTLNVAGITALGSSGGSGAMNWALRGVYQYWNGVNYNAAGGDLDLIKSWNGNTILGTKTDGTALGYVGIGTTAPAVKLQVGATGTNSGMAIQNIASYFVGPYNDTTNTRQLNVVGFGVTNIDTSDIYSQSGGENYKNWFVGTRSQGQYYGAPSFILVNRGIERFTVDTSGNVGIGTTSPTRKLHIAGDVQIDGAIYFGSDPTAQNLAYGGIQCTGGDYAESVDVSGDRTRYEPGDVLVLDSDNPGKMLKSIEAYSTSVSGIFSTKPGTVGRRQTTAKSPDEVPMAVVGIVPAKVSAENGSIKVGDLLVTSSTPGYAMKGTDRSRLVGAIVGKAMAKLDSGVGVIEVLVTLQ